MPVEIQPPTPFDQSLLWRLHDAYFSARGIDAWNQGEVPYYSTSNYASAKQHAGFLTSLVEAQIEGKRLAGDAPIWILEVGAGLGRFATNFLRAVEVVAGPELFGRVRYVLSDYAERNLREACATDALKAHVEAGRVVPALYDLRQPDALRFLDTKVEPPPRFQMVIANYVCCVVPLKNLQHREAEGWFEQWVRLEAKKKGVKRAGSVEALIEQMLADPTREGLVKSLGIHWEWRKKRLKKLYANGRHQAVLNALVRELKDATVGYPHAFIEFVDGAGKLLTPGGVVLVNDYGSVNPKEIDGLSEREPQIYGNSMANSINFAVFDAYAEVSGWHLMRSRDQLGSLHSAVLRPEVPWTERERQGFDDNYVKSREGDDILDYTHTARQCASKKDYERALRYWRRAIELEPEFADHYYKAGDTAIDFGRYDMAVEFLEKGRLLTRGDASLDFEFQLGRATCLLQDYEASIAWYEKALKNENHQTTWTNLGVLYENAERWADAFRCFKTALEIDPAYGRAKDRLLILKDRLWRLKIEEFEGPGAKDPLRAKDDDKPKKKKDDEDDG